MTERIILSGGREPLTKTIITIPPSQPVPQNSWTTVDIDIDQPSVQPTVEVENISNIGKYFETGNISGPSCSDQAATPLPGAGPGAGRGEGGGDLPQLYRPGGLAATLAYPGLRQGPVTPTPALAGD